MSKPPSGAAQPATVRPRDTSPRTLAELARSGFSLVLQPSMRVAYEVHHVDDHAGYLNAVLSARQRLPGRETTQDDTADAFIETLTTSAYGTGLVIGTRTITEGTEGPVLFGGPAPISVETRRDDFRLFTGTAVPNVSFVYNPANVFEGLIAIDDVNIPLQPWHGKAILDAIDHVAAIAAIQPDAAILSVQSPAQLPPEVYGQNAAPPGSWDEPLEDTKPLTWPLSAAVAVRFMIALTHADAKIRLALTDASAEFCRDRGFGLWVADVRSGFRAGSWFRIQGRDEARRTGAYGHRPDRERAADKQWSLPVTFVGPARPGTVRSIVNHLTSYEQIRLWACSMSIVDDVTFIHTQLTSTAIDAPAYQGLNDQLNAALSLDEEGLSELRNVSPLEVLPNLMAAMNATQIDGPPESDLRDRVADYHVLVGPAKQINGETGTNRLALWVSWEIEGQEAELSVPFLALHHVVQGLQTDWREQAPNLEYLICRRVRHASLRGKGKISFPSFLLKNFGEDNVATGLSGLCERVEEAWRSKLGTSRRVRELTVSWRENWLGHWNLPLD